MLGNDRKPIKTREGSVVELGQLLDEAVERAGAAYETSYRERQERGEDLPELGREERNRLAEVVGIGRPSSTRIFRKNRTSDYVFSWEKMLAMDGNTAAYMQYAYARNRSIFRRGAEDPALPYRSSSPSPRWKTQTSGLLAIQLCCDCPRRHGEPLPRNVSPMS